jgi:hypothetical protein
LNEQAEQTKTTVQTAPECSPTCHFRTGVYLTDTIGRFGRVCFRGEKVSNTYYGHLKRLAYKDGKYRVLITERKVKVFLRQAKHGKVKESHIQEIYDRTIRKIP